MFIAMNRFKVKKGSEEAFERVWMSRDSHLDKMPGFVEFHLLKGPEEADHVLYSSHTVWQNKATFEAWTKSEEFRKAHANAGNQQTGSLYLEHPKFEGFEVRQTLTRSQGRLSAMTAHTNLAQILAADPGAIVEEVAKTHRVTARGGGGDPGRDAPLRAGLRLYRRDDRHWRLGRCHADRAYRRWHHGIRRPGADRLRQPRLL